MADRGPVVGVEDAAAAVPQRHARDARGLQARDRPVERDQVGLAESVSELVRRQLGLECGGDEDRRLARVRVGAPANLVLEVLGEAEAEQGNRQQADEREGREQARPSATSAERLPQSVTIFGTNALPRDVRIDHRAAREWHYDNKEHAVIVTIPDAAQNWNVQLSF